MVGQLRAAIRVPAIVERPQPSRSNYNAAQDEQPLPVAVSSGSTGPTAHIEGFETHFGLPWHGHNALFRVMMVNDPADEARVTEYTSKSSILRTSRTSTLRLPQSHVVAADSTQVVIPLTSRARLYLGGGNEEQLTFALVAALAAMTQGDTPAHRPYAPPSPKPRAPFKHEST